MLLCMFPSSSASDRVTIRSSSSLSPTEREKGLPASKLAKNIDGSEGDAGASVGDRVVQEEVVVLGQG